MSKLEKLYEQSLMKWGFNWLPATPPGTYLHSFDEFKQKMDIAIEDALKLKAKKLEKGKTKGRF